MKKTGDFFEVVTNSETEVEKLSNDYLLEKKGKALSIYQFIEVALNSLYKYSTCAWGCFSNDHKFEAIIGRVVNHSLSALKLMKGGYYDESLSLVRNLSELANLTTLFIYNREDFDKWTQLEENEAWKKYGPSKVRDKIKALGKIDPIEKTHYSTLCTIGVHVTPKTKPANYSLYETANVGSCFQEIGFLMCLNELGLMLGPIIMGVGKISNLPEKIKEIFVQLSVSVVESTGELTTQNYKQIIKDISKH